jgi:hypothetical protein
MTVKVAPLKAQDHYDIIMVEGIVFNSVVVNGRTSQKLP